MNRLHKILAALRARQEEQTGFTLVEVVVTLALVSVLATIATPVYAGVMDNSKRKATKSAAMNGLTAITAAQVDDNPATTLETAFNSVNTSKMRVYFFDGQRNPVDANGVRYDERLFCVRADVLKNGFPDWEFRNWAGPGCNSFLPPGWDS